MYIWDLPLRLFHWLLVLGILTAYITGEMNGLWLNWHAQSGTFILSLIIFRIVWGFTGSTYARFSSFAPTPHRIKVFYSSTQSDPGHNPLGAISIFALLSVILIQASFGLFSINDEIEYHAPLYDLVNAFWSNQLTVWHSQLFDMLSILIGIHLIAIGYYTWFKYKNLVMPMITGYVCIKNRSISKTIQGGGIFNFLLAATISGLVFWSIESGALLQWLLPNQLMFEQPTLTPAW